MASRNEALISNNDFDECINCGDVPSIICELCGCCKECCDCEEGEENEE